MFSQVIALAPDSIRGYYDLGATYNSQGRYERRRDRHVATLNRHPADRRRVQQPRQCLLLSPALWRGRRRPRRGREAQAEQLYSLVEPCRRLLLGPGRARAGC